MYIQLRPFQGLNTKTTHIKIATAEHFNYNLLPEQPHLAIILRRLCPLLIQQTRQHHQQSWSHREHVDLPHYTEAWLVQ